MGAVGPRPQCQTQHPLSIRSEGVLLLSGAMPRLVICHVCKSIDEIPSLSPDARKALRDEPDPLLLNVLSNRHNHGPLRIGGADEQMAVVEVDDLEWMRPEVRDEILSRFKHQWSGFEPELYALRSTFHEDALRCFSRHHRPKEGCIDYLDDSKLLTPTSWKTDAEDQIDRVDLLKIIDETRKHRKPVHLCNFCPVQAYVTTRRRDQLGAYDKKPGETE